MQCGRREIVMEAVKLGGLALEFASDRLKNDREVVLEAVTQDKTALRHASADLQEDEELIALTAAEE